MIHIDKKENCCGCGACANACPKSCIKMTADEEGFLYPHIDMTVCINCGICEKVCPEINVKPDTPKAQKAYLVQHKDENIRLDSSAGGAFTAIAEYVIEQSGVVFGAKYDEKLNVVHACVESKEELFKFRNSKYVQSDIKNSFYRAKSFLDEGRWVCFSGTPCQIEGLKGFLQKDYEKLVLVDVACHAVPSPFVWNKYKDYIQSKYKDVVNIRFRDKYYGYRYSTMSVYCKGQKEPAYHEGIDTDFMLRAFFSDICDRPSCYECSFKKRYHVSDFTIWDCFIVGEIAKELDDNKGTTRVLIQSNKGEFIFEQIKDKLVAAEVTPDKLVENVKEMFHSVSMNTKRKEFFDDLQSLSAEEMIKKYFPNGIRSRFEKFVRISMCKLGIYDTVKKNVKKILNR